MIPEQIQNTADRLRDYFFSGRTRDINFRIKQLRKLKKAIEKNETKIIQALNLDLGKPETEAYIAEIAIIIYEIETVIKQLKSWTKPEKVSTPFSLFPGSSYIYPEPYGVVLIVSPWNYPFQLAIAPLVGAISAGNCAVIKPSEISPNTSDVIAQLVENCFDPDYITVIEGAKKETQTLLSQKFDYIFFTGGSHIGKIVMEAASKHLTPVTLELGGKNPCIIDKGIDTEMSAKRIAWAKFFNAGQTCVAPDYLLVHPAVKSKFLESLKKTITQFYGDDPHQSPDYARIVNRQHFDRLSQMMEKGEIIAGGETSAEDLYIAPTVIDGISWHDPIMQEEIFGPILPVLEYENLNQVISSIRMLPKPLALYLFSRNEAHQEKLLTSLSSGALCINDAMGHVGNQDLPFGGVGDSGMGAYHGKLSFDTFSHKKSVLKRGIWLDPPIKYPPYKIPLGILKPILKHLF